MKQLDIKCDIHEFQMDELPEDDQRLLRLAVEATARSYTPYSHFNVGAALRLENGVEVMGCNQENAAFPVGICAERAALFSAGAQYPDQAVTALAIAARSTDGELLDKPVSPCGTCRQAIIETETRFHRPVRILLYGRKCVYVMDGIRHLMPLSFTEF